jgi:hypothetical protein
MQTRLSNDPAQVNRRGLSVSVNHEKPILSQRHAQARFGGPCRGRTHGPLIKSLAEDLPQNTQENVSLTKEEDS